MFDWMTWSVWLIGLVILVIWIVVPIREFRQMWKRMSGKDREIPNSPAGRRR